MRASRLLLAAAALAAAAAAFAVYANGLRNGFVWDDHIYIEDNVFVRDPANYRKLLSRGFWIKTDEPIEDAARPMFVASLLADRALWGANPRGYHLTNILLHCAVTVLVFLVSLIVLPAPAAAAAALLFAVHPANSEAVDLVSFRMDLLAALFLLAAVGLHWKWRRARRLAWSAAGIAGCAVLYALGLLSKEMAATFPALALAVEWTAWPRGESRRWRRLCAGVAVYACVAGGYLLFRAPRSGYGLSRPAAVSPAPAPAKPAVPKAFAPPPAGVPALPPPPPARAQGLASFPPSRPQWQRMYDSRLVDAWTMSGVLGQELEVLAFGGPLRADRAPILLTSARSPRVWGVWLILLLAAALAAWAWRSAERLPALALAWVLIGWIPVSNVIPIYNPIAERYLYLLSVGAAWAAAWALNKAAAKLARGRRPQALAALALAAVLALPLGLKTFARNRDWKSDQTLFAKEASEGARNARVYYNLGVAARSSGDDRRAEARFRQALALNPRSVETLTDLASLLCARSRCAEGEALLRRAVAQNPTNFVPYLALAQALSQRGRPADALPWYLKAYEASSHGDRASAIGLAQASLATGRGQEEALAALRGLEARDPKDREASELFALISWLMGRRDAAASAAAGTPGQAAGGQAYAALGALLESRGLASEAWKAYAEAARRDPGCAQAQAGMGRLLLGAGRYEQAAPFFARAERLDASDPYASMNLGVCEQHLGRVADAEAAMGRALSRGGSGASFYFNMGSAYADDPAKLPQAEDAFRQALAAFPDYADAWYDLGVVALKRGRKDDALEDFQTAAQKDPSNLPALNNAAALLLDKGDKEGAGRLLRRALAVRPDSPSVLNNLGELLLSEGRFSQAAQRFAAAVADGRRLGDDPPSLARYAANLAKARSLAARK